MLRRWLFHVEHFNVEELELQLKSNIFHYEEFVFNLGSRSWYIYTIPIPAYFGLWILRHSHSEMAQWAPSFGKSFFIL